ncbi:hypothetical protein RZS08_30720, partial [Arthrospira platensis SPKY1]|nr:hypothetical protein [Arthrospira platensis SPKY1]
MQRPSSALPAHQLEAHIHGCDRHRLPAHHAQQHRRRPAPDLGTWGTHRGESRHGAFRPLQVVEARHPQFVGHLHAGAQGLEQRPLREVVVAEEQRLDVRVAPQVVRE